MTRPPAPETMPYIHMVPLDAVPGRTHVLPGPTREGSPFELTVPRRSDKLVPLSKHASGMRTSPFHRFSPFNRVRLVLGEIASQLFAAVDADA